MQLPLLFESSNVKSKGMPLLIVG